MKQTRIMGLATCYNRKEKTVKALSSLISGNENIEFSFVITDDNSSDGTSDALADFKEVTVVHGNGKSFYSGGMRLAMTKALEMIKNAEVSPDYILLFNDDVEFYDKAIEGLVERALDKEDTPKEIIFVGPTCEADRVTLSYGGVSRKSDFRPKFNKVKAITHEGRRVHTFNANCVIVPTDLFIKTGIIDKVYNHSLGDFDYGYCLRRNGGEIYVSDEFIGICPFNSDEGTWNDTKLSRRERLRKKESIKGVPFKEFFHYLFKNYNLLTAIIYSISPYIRVLLGR